MVCVKVSKEEIRRGDVLSQVLAKELSRKRASALLKISLRQLDRLALRYRERGLEGLIHGNRGKPSNNTLDPAIRAKIVKHVSKSYQDFGPTLAKENLAERQRIIVSKEKLRQIMKEEGFWKAKKRKTKGYHPRRKRRNRFGELLQGDGSHHLWFEDRGPRCTLIAYIDDATNKVTARFEPSETTLGYMSLFRRYVEKYGVPNALYVDKHSIFRVNCNEESKGIGETQFHRVLNELEVELICANSPQAKGRIERLFGTLQDRLVKELRLAKVSTIEAGNHFLESFLERFNKRWGCAPIEDEDFHRSQPSSKCLDRIFTIRETRKMSKALDFSYEGKLYQVVGCKTPHRLMNKPVTILEDLEGKIWFESEGERLEVKLFNTLPARVAVLDSKELASMVDAKPQLSAIQRHRRGLGRPR